MDNFHIDVVCQGKAELKMAIELAIKGNRSLKGVKAFLVEDAPLNRIIQKTSNAEHLEDAPVWRRGVPEKHQRMVLFWWERDTDKATVLPFAMDHEMATEFAWKWLETLDFGDEPGHDGSNGRGWRVYTTDWGHVDNYRGAICAIEPAWAMYGK